MVPYTPETLAVLTTAEVAGMFRRTARCITNWARNYRGQYRDYNHHSYRQCSLTASL